MSEDNDWKTEIAGESEEAMAALADFNSPVDLGKAYLESQNRDWRTEFAGEDEDKMKTLQRFKTREDFLGSYLEAQNKIRSGDLLKPLPDDATEDDVKAYREQHGIPLESKGYFEAMPEGLVLAEEDQPIVEKFAEVFHAHNLKPAVVHDIIKAYNEIQVSQSDDIGASDAEDRTKMEEALRDEWGSDFRANTNLATAALGQLPEEARELIKNARVFADGSEHSGKALWNVPDIFKWLSSIGRELFPGAAVTPSGASDDQSLVQLKEELEKKMNTPEWTDAVAAKHQQVLDAMLRKGLIDEYGNVKAA